MIVINSLAELEIIKENTGVGLGTFDGIHLGHRTIIENLVLECKKRHLKSVLYTFSNHPREITLSHNQSTRILPTQDKIAEIEALGVDYLVIVKFDGYHMNIEAKHFIKEILINKMHAKLICVGYNYRFGRNAEGDVVLLQKFDDDFEVIVTEPIYHNGELVSSSLIRSLLNNGFVENANELIGKPYRVRGVVIHGKRMGHKLGFPTANLMITDDMTVLKAGVYITKTIIDDQSFLSVTNVGYNPTFEQTTFNVETYILDFHRDIYGEIIDVEFIHRIRDEMRFTNMDDLTNRIQQDVDIARKQYFTGQ